jgi:hypothetical protein
MNAESEDPVKAQAGWLTGEWSPIYRLTADLDGSEPWYEHCPPKTKGVYRLVALSKNGRPAPIRRACGVDMTGTLQIGASSNLESRLGSLVKTHRPDRFSSGGHNRLRSKLAERFPPERLGLTWQRTRGDPYKREEQLIAAYDEEFGDHPPNNRQ